MIKDHQREFNKLHVVLDALVIIVSYGLAWLLMINGFVPTKGEPLQPEFYIIALVVVVPVYLLLYAVFHLYTPKRVQGRRLELANICKANSIGLLTFTLVLYLLSKNPYWINFSRPMVLYFFVLNIVFETAERNAIRMMLRSMRSKGYNLKHILWWATAARQRAISTGWAPIPSGDTGSPGFWIITSRLDRSTGESASSGRFMS